MSRSMSPPKHDPAKQHCSLNMEASRTNVSEETPYNWRLKSVCVRPGRNMESLERDGTRTSRPAKLSPIPDDAASIVHRLMGLPVIAGCDTAWDRTRVCSDAFSRAMQCLRLLCHSEGPALIQNYS
jgi:hypothetical protein